jgi:hypothetical protein
MENIEILERLRGYDFFRINLKYEYEERLEKFLILASKINKFQLENGNLLNYEIIKKLLKKKNLRMVRDESAFRKLKLQEIVKENISTMKWRILDDLNAIFREDNIKFCFNKNFSDEQIEEQPKEFDKVKIENYLKILRFYTFNKVKTDLFEEYEDRLGRLLLLAKKSKAIKFIDENKEEQELNYETVVSLMEKKDLSLQMSRIKFKQNSSFSSNSYLATSESYKKRIINDLNTIFKEENIIFELDESKSKEVIEDEVPKKKQTISERLEKYKIPLLSTGTFARYRENLEKFLMAVAKTHLFMKKKTKEPLTYPVIKELLSKKTLVMQTDKFEFSLKKLSTISPYIYDNLNQIQLMLLEDLNAIFDEEDIEFDFIEYVNKDEFIKAVKYQEKEEKNMENEEDSLEMETKVENEVEVEVKNEKVDMLIENSDGKSKLENFVERLRKYHFRNIRQGLDKEYTDRLEKLFILVGKSKRVLVKNTKQIVDYEVAVSLMKKKGLKFQATKKEYNNGGFPENLARKFETYKNNIIEDLNTLYENEEIEFCLVDDILSENTINKIIPKETSEETFENTKESNNTETEKLSEEIKTLKATIEEMNKAIAVLKSNNIENEISKLKVEIPDFINEMECNDILSIKANREHFKKFKRFALYNNINIGTLVNYLFYYAMEELTK